MNIRQIRLFSLLLTVAFIVCAGFVYKFNRSASANSEVSNIILDLAAIDVDVGQNFKNIIGTSNYDRLNQNLRNFDRNLTYLRRLNEQNLIKNIYDASKDIAKAREIYNSKRKLIDIASYLNSGLNAFLAAMKHDLVINKNMQDVGLIYLRLKNIKNFELAELDDIKANISSILDSSAGDTARAEALKKASFVLEAMMNLAQISKQDEELKFGEFIAKFRAQQLAEYKNLITRLKVLQTTSFLLFFVLLAFVIYQTRKSEDNAKKISMLQTMIDADHSSIVFTDRENKILYANKTFENVTGYKFSDVVGKRPNVLKSSVHSEDFYDQLRQAVRQGKEWESNELISRAKNGKLVYERVKILPFYFQRKLEGYIAIKLDRTKEASMINELAVKNEQIKAQSTIDKLTGFGNYFALTERLEAREDGMIICMSVKNFKSLRFFYQTKIIDEIIRSMAGTLRLCIDTTEMNAQLYRFADDSFYVWYQGEHIVRDIAYLQEYFSFKNLELNVDGKSEALPGLKIILGVSLSSDTMQTNRLMQSVLANQQAYNSNKEVYYYQENDAIELQHYKNQITTQLIEYALTNDMVIVECQGIYDVQFEGEEADFYEVLVRLIDQNGKIRYPGEFLSVAMQTQLYTQITKKVIEQAFILVERYPHYTFSVNLSGSDIADSSVRELLEEKLRVCSRPEHICFEMLESEEMEDYDTIRSFIKRVKGYGCKISIDDFGSGYSNYYRILELDIDNIKIDGSIIKKLPFDQNARVLVETIVNFASKQGYKVVAEFVSSPEILEQVKHFGIKYAQGFLLGKPKRMN